MRGFGKNALLVLLAALLCWTPARAAEAAGVSQSGRVVAEALAQMGLTEEDDEHTPFGDRFGFPNGHWCDMFVSWCAEEAGVSPKAFPRSVSCTRHCRAFTALGRYYDSAARGGSYVPLQGDLALFCNIEGQIHHIGLVLYVEDETLFTVEGNALTVRWDYPPETVGPARVPEEEPNDYVTVNRYPLGDWRIHGYAVPAYDSREPLALEGFVDLGRYGYAREPIEALAAAGILEGTSSHTFSPRAGMGRGEFVKTVLNLYGFAGWRPGTVPFDDVPFGHPCYSAVMTARSAGLLPEAEGNRFDPDRWISGEDAQFILSALLKRLGLPDHDFRFTPGDLSQILTPYTTRGDIAQALWFLRDAVPLPPETFTSLLPWGVGSPGWLVQTVDGVCCIPWTFLRDYFPALSLENLPRN
ncbi:S-layer homology domain-containing protein [Oscillibacter sp.]|uniref:S-layer homology domain-containing protein n=1 Tax=Oscillibacter sp. TaxID=1945593 RepID=UPI002D7ED6AE|nr:S-layer homology domain-containing protein [Oscillibacter sp.]